MLSIDEIRRALDRRDTTRARFEPAPHHAAVAMILADGDDGLDVCFIRRAERDGDPWSGQVAFPGGRAAGADPDPPAVAARETAEEIGLCLDERHLVGALPVRPNVRGNLTLWPFVFHVEPAVRAEARVCMPHEVASVFWVPLRHLFDHQAVTELEYPLGGSPSVFPGIDYDGHVIWGLTLRVLGSFADVVQREMPAVSDG